MVHGLDFRDGSDRLPQDMRAVAAILLALGHLLLQIIDKMLRPFSCQHFPRLVRHVRLLTQRLEFLPLRLGHHWFVHGRSVTRWLFPASRRSALTPELW